MGARVAMHLALVYPNLVNNLVIVDMSPLPLNRTSSFSIYFDALEHVAHAQVRSAAEAEELMKHYVANTTIRQFLLTNLVRKDNVLVPRVNLPVLRASLDHLWDFDIGDRRFTKPSLFIGKVLSFFVFIYIIYIYGNTCDNSFTLCYFSLYFQSIGGAKADYMGPNTHGAIKNAFPTASIHMLNTGHWVHSEDPSGFLTLVQDWLKRRT